MNKRGVAWEQIFKALIMVAVLVVVFLIFFGGIKGPKETLAEGIANIVKKAGDVFKVLQEPTTALDTTPKKFSKLTEVEKSNVLSQTKEKAEELGCEQNEFGGYISYYAGIISICKGDKSIACESTVPDSYFRIAECYKKVNLCNEAVNYYTQLIDNYKSSNLLISSKRSLAKCYENLGNKDRAALIYAEIEEIRFGDIAEVEELQEKLDINLEETYGKALTNYNNKNYNYAINRLNDLRAELRKVEDSELKKSGSKELKREFQLASLYWIKRAELEEGRLDCESFKNALDQQLRVREENLFLKFPVPGTTYFNEPIVSRIYFDVAECFLGRGRRGDREKGMDYYRSILTSYNKNSIGAIIREMKKRVMPTEGCSKFDDDDISCNSLNFEWADVKEIGEDAQEFRCFWVDGNEMKKVPLLKHAFSGEKNKCISCTQIQNKCQLYGSGTPSMRPNDKTCIIDPCGLNCQFISGLISGGCIPS